ncbi:MAG: hypothetical protein GX868_15505 [Actinobacteria bacterium]|nr:hypothetical protein [Actinomycetota bacterium]
MTAVAPMSKKTADVLFGSTAPELGELMGIVRKIIAALDASSDEPDERYGVCRRLRSVKFVAPTEPELDWSAPMPPWPKADYSLDAIGRHEC